MRTTKPAGVALLLTGIAAATSLAAGVIVIDRTTLTIGRAATRGTVEIDSAGEPGEAPSIPAPAGPGTQDPLTDYYGAASRDLPTQRGGGSQAFHATSDVSLAGGTYDWSSITIDAGAVQALRSGKSLLPAGVTAVNGRFARGDTVSVLDQEGVEIARGMAAYDDKEASRIRGKRSADIEALVGFRGRVEMIHRDNLVILRADAGTTV